jgi:uncharacterized membrane protein YkoI
MNNRISLLAAAALFAVAGTQAANAQVPAAPANTLSLSAAIDAAQKAAPGTVIEVDTDSKRGVRRYEVTVLSAEGSVEKLALDPVSGQVLERKTRREKGWFGKAALPAGEKPILAAIAAAEKDGGVATEAERKEKYGRVYYEIELQQGPWNREVRVDATTGELLPPPAR